MSRFKPRMDILPTAQQRLWHELAAAPGLGFVLYGGTAVALRLGHRQSVDFDFFSDKPLDRMKIHDSFRFFANATVVQDYQNALTVLVAYGDSQHSHVKVSFFGMLGFGRVGRPDFTEDGVLQVACLDDLMATKVKVILQRAEAKDYRDIAAMIKAGANLPRALAAACQFFGQAFQPSESLKALVYFSDGDLQTLTGDEKSTLVMAASAVRDLPDVAVLSKQLAVTNETAGN